MARPTKNNAEYFSHDAGMRNDPKIRALRKRFINGYAVYCMLLEVLTATDFFKLEIEEIQLEILAGDFDTDVETLQEIINFCVKIKLLSEENGIINSCGLNKRLQGVLDKRNSAKERFAKQKPQNKVISVTETPQSKVKYSKVKESKDNYIHNYSSTAAADVAVEEAKEETIFSKKNIVAAVEINEKNAAEILDFSDLNENSTGLFPEEEFINAFEGLKGSGELTLIKIQHEKEIVAIEKLFRVFFEQKYFGNEIRNYRNPKEFYKNFYYWIPKYKQSQKMLSKQEHGNANSNNRKSTSATAIANENRAKRDKLNAIANAVLLGAKAQ